jgi:hypothetical protein
VPTLTYQVPQPEWAKLEEKARRDGVSVRVWVLWRLKAAIDQDDAAQRDAEQLEPVA